MFKDKNTKGKKFPIIIAKVSINRILKKNKSSYGFLGVYKGEIFEY